MLVLRFGPSGEPPAHFTTTLDELAIGSDPAADLVLASARIAPRHARLVRTDGAWVLHPVDPRTSVNDTALTSPRPLALGDTFVLPPYVFAIEQDPTLAEEQRLLDALGGADETSRAVYADWLEQRGHADRAEFLRAQLAVSRLTPADRAFAAATERVRALATTLSVEWRMRVARPAVEGCKLAREFTCGVDWAELAPTADPAVRTCTRCREPVRYCRTETEAIAEARAGHCIVVDFAHWRRPTSIESLSRTPDPGAIAPPGMYLPMTHLAPPPRPAPPPPPPPRTTSRLWTCPDCDAANIAPRCGQCGRDLS